MKTKICLLILGAGLLVAVSCSKYPSTSDRLLEDLVVLTQYDTKINFNEYLTYSMPTSIVKVTSTDTTYLTNSEAMACLNEIDKQMQSRGFVKSVSPAKPDLGIQVTYYENTYVQAYYYPGGYWGYPYYYYYYPYYPTYYSTYTAGMANIGLFDLKNVTQPNNTIYLRWNAMIRGLLTNTHTNSDIINAIDQAFVQTPQLKTILK
jgi:hypothetical protein